MVHYASWDMMDSIANSTEKLITLCAAAPQDGRDNTGNSNSCDIINVDDLASDVDDINCVSPIVTDSIYFLSANCTIQNGILYVDGIPVGQLTPEQKTQLQQFQQQAQQWIKTLMNVIQQQIQQGLNKIFGQSSTDQASQQMMEDLAPFPSLPAFCK
uniref:Pepsin-I3 domain-containing protein n=1 Tax=Ascaris lumbricoides TaxID=6252 RepID=A0A0M3IMU5_ASCLU